MTREEMRYKLNELRMMLNDGKHGEEQGILVEIISELDKLEWIPVSERLPEEIGTYLVTLEYKEHGQGITTLWYHGEGIGWDLRAADVVTAWQPLPKPYKAER